MPRDFSSSQANTNGAASNHGPFGLPLSLKLEFSKAADYKRIDNLFDPKIKKQIDPNDFVLKRREEHFSNAVKTGGAGMLSDKKGNVHTLTIIYRFSAGKNPAPLNQHEYSEFGTGLSATPGYGSAKLVMAALALREWFKHPPKKKLVNEISKHNVASIKTYIDKLQWKKITDPAERDTLFESKYLSVGDGSPPDAKTRAEEDYCMLTDKALAVHARILLEFMKQGGLLNQRTGHHIPVDFSSLDKEGLTKKRIEAIAHGNTNRAALRKLG